MEAQHRLAEEPAGVGLDELAPPQRLESRVEVAELARQEVRDGCTRELPSDDCSSLEGTGIQTETLPESDQYELQGTAFSRAVRGEVALPFGVDDAIANMRVIDALFRSEKSGRWEAIG
jgi:predicted dehydrogenase